MNRSFRHRTGALAGVLLAATVVLAWASPASAQTATASQARFDNVVANCPAVPSAQNIQGPVVRGTATADQIQCLVTANSASAQVTGTYSGGDFDLKCTIANGFVSTIKRVGSAPQELTYTPYTGGPVTVSAVVDGVVVSVTCGAPAPPYPLAVDVGAASGGGPDLATQAATSTESSGSGTTWLFVAGAAALLLVGGQLAIGRRIGRNQPVTD